MTQTTIAATQERHDEPDTLPTAGLTQSVLDFDLTERLQRALSATGHGALRAVKVSVRGGIVVLEGRAPSYHIKQIALAAALSVARTYQIHDDLEVIRPT